MKDDLTNEQRERLQDQDDFITSVKNATGNQGDGKNKKKPGDVDIDAKEREYQKKQKKKLKPAVNNINPKYQSPLSDLDPYKTTKPNPVNESIRIGGDRVKKIIVPEKK